MILITDGPEMVATSRSWRQQGESIAVVPTMGCLHEGHLSLVKKGRELAERVVATIFVNPLQFGPHEDLDAYPRQLEEDSRLLENEGVGCLFCPPVELMYPEQFQTQVRVKKLSQGMCGEDRPGHFDGVATVVSKLFNLVQPDFALFGEKDFQQLAIIKQLVDDLNFPVEIVGCPIVREKDGLAMSSRNNYLRPEDREAALSLSQSIQMAKEMVRAYSGTIKSAPLIEGVKACIKDAGGAVEYAVIVNGRTLEPQEWVQSGSVLAVAAKIRGKIRLIDNSVLLEP